MILKELILEEEKIKGHESLFISGIHFSSREVKKGGLFVAIRGDKKDGHDFLEEALKNGASAFVVEKKDKIPPSFKGPVIEVKDTRKSLSLLSSRFYKNPSKLLRCIGVTGTNGKTTVTSFLRDFLSHQEKKVGLIGTLETAFEKDKKENPLTTPDSLFLQKTLRDWKDRGCEFLVMEASSHAIHQKRVEGIFFDVLCFTNLSQDHLDYHSSMEDYFSCKESLFRNHPESVFVVNEDDPYAARIKKLKSKKTIAVSSKNKSADLFFCIKKSSLDDQEIEITYEGQTHKLFLNFPGIHNAQNAVLALGACLGEGISLEKLLKAPLSKVSGRLEKVSNDLGFYVFVDYAHTPGGLESVLKTMSFFKKKRIFTVFGCGGDRDKEKRSLMMEKALMYSDKVYLTSDNPRGEDPLKIMEDAMKGAGLRKDEVFKEPDRKKAITQVLKDAKKGDVVFIFGKGHESYQLQKGEKIPFSDVEVCKEVLKCL